MNALSYASGLALAFVLVMVLVNSSRVSELRDDLNSLPTAQGTVSGKDTSLATGLKGVVVPKSYYWVDVVGPVVPSGGTGDVDRLEVTLDDSEDTDGAKMVADVASGRVTFVYRPERNIAYRVEPMPAGTSASRNHGFVVVKNKDSPAFISDTASLPEDGRITLVGLPEGVVNGQSA